MSQKVFGFYISDAMAERIRTLLDKVYAASDKRPFAMDLFRIIEELADTGLNYFFIIPLKKAKIGGFTIKAVEMAMNVGKSGVLKIGKSVIKGMDNQQLMVVAELLENSLTERKIPDLPQEDKDGKQE